MSYISANVLNVKIMKSIIRIFAIGIIFFGAPTLMAQSLSQDADKPENIAERKIAELDKTLDLTGDQERALFRAYVSKEVNYKKYVNGNDAADAEVKANKSKFDSLLKEAVQKTLTKEQFEVWVKMK